MGDINYEQQRDAELTLAEYRTQISALIKTKQWRWIKTAAYPLGKHSCDAHWNIVIGEFSIAQFTLIQMPGCCGICISTSAQFLQRMVGRWYMALRIPVLEIQCS